MNTMHKKTVSQPDERRTFDKGQVDLVSLGGVTFGRARCNRVGSGQLV